MKYLPLRTAGAHTHVRADSTRNPELHWTRLPSINSNFKQFVHAYRRRQTFTNKRKQSQEEVYKNMDHAALFADYFFSIESLQGASSLE
jgi:hypothetical protein